MTGNNTPYYTDDHVSLYHGDSLDVLPSITAGTVTAVVTDPPYVIGAVSAGNMKTKAGGWGDMMNSALWFTTWYRETGRLLKHDGSLWTFCNWRSLPVVMRAASDANMPMTSLMVWDKQTIGPGGKQGLRPSYELCALMANPGFAVQDRATPDIWPHKVGPHRPNGHPAEKPVGLVERILRTCSLDFGDLVLDPFVGSGTTAVAAKLLGMRCIAVEAEERYCEITAKRLSQGALALDGSVA